MDHASLTPVRIAGDGFLPERAAGDAMALDVDDPATLAVTDFTREHPITVDEERQIDAALQDMIRFGVRALLVLRERRIVGLITSYDIQGERPLQFLQNSNYEHHRDVRVGHIMTPWPDLLAVDWRAVQSARAGELYDVLRHAGLSHLLVVEKRGDDALVVRALVSHARLERQLNVFAGNAAARDARAAAGAAAPRKISGA
ncbi:MAG TPA: CBS domain-containing protein [Steroidobacteraceae bacterium]|nr:CBS domain-containing protein [Steroidobacteraceae bacterium]